MGSMSEVSAEVYDGAAAELVRRGVFDPKGDITSRLVLEKVINKDEKETIDSKPTRSERTEALFFILKRKSAATRAYEKLCRITLDTGNEVATEILRNAPN